MADLVSAMSLWVLASRLPQAGCNEEPGYLSQYCTGYLAVIALCLGIREQPWALFLSAVQTHAGALHSSRPNRSSCPANF